MRGRTVKTVIFLLLLLIADILIVTNSSADISVNNFSENVITVSRFGGDYSNIQEAIDQAIEGSTIFIKTGIYTEIIDINKKLTIIGENKFSTIINPISQENKYAIRLVSPGIIIKNLSITNGASGLYTTGVRISAQKSKIYNCNIYDNPICVAIFSNENIIDNCFFWNCKDEAIAMIGTKISKCDFNIVSNCTFFNNCDGIELQYSSNNTIDNCSIYNNTHSGIDAIVSSNNGNIIKNCEIYNNNVNGIYLSASSNNKIIECDFSNNDDGDVIITEDSSNNLVIDLEQKEIFSKNEKIDFNQKIETNQKFIIEENQKNNEVHSNKIFNNLFEMISNLLPILKTILIR